MKFFVLALLVALCAARVHEFHAENNYICTLCETTVDILKSKNDGMMKELVEK
jgi:hypothetical protein